ncbi:hypothetical protein [Azospirillum argentinense]
MGKSPAYAGAGERFGGRLIHRLSSRSLSQVTSSKKFANKYV